MRGLLIAASLILTLPAVAQAQRTSAEPGERDKPGVEEPSSPQRDSGRTGGGSTPRTGTRRPGTDEPTTPTTRRTPTDDPRPTRETRTTEPADLEAPMRFEIVREGPADKCGEKCRTWVSARGTIALTTAKDFEEFAKGRERELRGAVVVLDSTGGAVLPGIELGRAFRKLDMLTTVGRTEKLSGRDDGEPRGTISPRGICASMCVFSLLGGTKRFVPPEAKVLVHQIWLATKRNDAAAQTYSAENIVALQRSLGVLARFTAEMGGDIEIFELSMRIPPWENLRSLTPEELKRLKLRTVDSLFDSPLASVSLPTNDTATPTPPANDPSIGNTWQITQRDGLTGLARRHPLTIEGDEIGSFVLMFSCGDKPGEYALRYSETRKQTEKSELKKVALASGRQRITLDVKSSTASDAKLESVATGAMPTSALRAFAEQGAPSLVVSTETANDVKTLIRIGNTGIDDALPDLASSCRR